MTAVTLGCLVLGQALRLSLQDLTQLASSWRRSAEARCSTRQLVFVLRAIQPVGWIPGIQTWQHSFVSFHRAALPPCLLHLMQMNRPPGVPWSEHGHHRSRYLALTPLQVCYRRSPVYRRIGRKEEAHEPGVVSTFDGHSDDGSGTRSGDILEK